MKILHSADWHLGSPLQGKTQEQTALLRRELSLIPGKITALCKQEQCDLMLLAGDLLDSPQAADCYPALYRALEDAAVPVFITPGNHDFLAPDSLWLTKSWPENVHIFTKPELDSVFLPQLNCRVYGAGFTSMDCDGLLSGFTAAPGELAIGILHGDPTQVSSPYCPITRPQVKASGLAYLALGHIHKGGAFTAGSTLCAWPGCPMGRGYDEQGEKGALIVTIGEEAQTRFVPLDTPKFFDLEVEALEDPVASLASLLPALGSDDFYRITLTGPSQPLDLSPLKTHFSHFPNLELRDATTPPVDIWTSAGEDSLEGTYFELLQQALASADPQTQKKILLAARISRQILDGQEVRLP